MNIIGWISNRITPCESSGVTNLCRPRPEWGGLSQDELSKLAAYNAEVSRGIVHTTEWMAYAAGLQERFNGRQFPG